MILALFFIIHVHFPCNGILLQRSCLFCYLNWPEVKDVSFLKSTVLYTCISFHLSQLMPVYPLEYIKGLKQFMNMYTTNLTVKIYLRRSPTWVRKQHWWDITCPGIPYTVPKILSSLCHFKDARSVSLHHYNRSQILQYVEYTK